MPPEDANIPPSERKTNLPQYGLRSLFWLTLVAALYSGLVATVQWRNNLAWPNQLWALLLIIIVVGLVFTTRGTAMRAVVAGFLLINVPYLPFWSFVYLVEGHGAEVLWCVVYAGLHGAGLLGGVFAIARGHPAIGVTTIAIMALSMALNYALHGPTTSLFFVAFPPNILPGQY